MSWFQAVCTVGKYPTHRLIASAALSTHIGTASTETPRRHHCAPRQPRISTPTARPVAAIQIHSRGGAGSPATPSKPMYQCAHSASTTPPTNITGIQTVLQRCDRQPIAHTTAVAATSCAAAGSQPWISDRCEM